MNKMFRIALVILVALTLTTMTTFAAEMPKVGDKAPDFSLKSQKGSTVALKNYPGKWVVLYFYPQAMTPGCRIELHSFNEDFSKYNELNAVVVGVSADPISKLNEFCDEQKSYDITLLSDEKRQVIKETYGVLNAARPGDVASRFTFVIDPQGVIRQVYTEVQKDIAGHSKQVLADLRKLQGK